MKTDSAPEWSYGMQLDDDELESRYQGWKARVEKPKRKLNWWMLGSIVFSVVWSAAIWGLAVYGLVGLARRVFKF